MRLREKVAVITGAGSGFGESMAKRFAAEGAEVVVADINDDGGERVVSEIGDAARFVHTDVRKGAELGSGRLWPFEHSCQQCRLPPPCGGGR